MNKTSPVRGELLGVAAASKRAGMSKSWLENRTAAGTLPFDHLRPTPGKIMFDSADIDDWLCRIRVRAGNPPGGM